MNILIQTNVFLSTLDWNNLLAGAVFAVFTSAIVSLMRGLYGYYIISRDLPYPIWGIWFSAEFDPKGFRPEGVHNIELSGRNTFLRIRIKRRLGRKIIIKAENPLEDLPQKIPTKWIGHGHLVQGNTFVGIWKSTITHTSRHGTAIIKFLDHGRALGFWTGSSETGYPIYRYWIISRTKKDAENIAKTMFAKTNFKTLDLASYAIQYLPIDE